jgi:DNA repair protein RecO (recombination protein O)
LGEALLTEVVHWEITVLADLGYGLDLSACAVTGQTADLVHVSPRTGRAVSRGAAGDWAARLLPLPAFLLGTEPADMAQWRDGLRLTGHFLARDAFGHQHRPLPRARQMLYDRVAALAAQLEKDVEPTHAG